MEQGQGVPLRDNAPPILLPSQPMPIPTEVASRQVQHQPQRGPHRASTA